MGNSVVLVERGAGMRRRDVIAGVASVVALQGFANAQREIRRIAMLLAVAEDDPVLPRFIAAVEQGLQSLGWKPGCASSQSLRQRRS